MSSFWVEALAVGVLAADATFPGFFDLGHGRQGTTGDLHDKNSKLVGFFFDLLHNVSSTLEEKQNSHLL